MDVKALKILKKIVNMEGIDRKSGTDARNKALDQWLNDWIVEVKTSQSVIKKSLSLDDEEFIKYYLSYRIGDRLMDDCIYVESTPTKIATRILAIKR